MLLCVLPRLCDIVQQSVRQKSGLLPTLAHCYLALPRLHIRRECTCSDVAASVANQRQQRQQQGDKSNAARTRAMCDTRLNVVFVLGKPGSGKGTQCARIVSEFTQCKHLSAGDLLRAEQDQGGHVSDLIKTHIREGSIVPVAITIGLLKKAMERLQATEAAEGGRRLLFLIDGFPRNKDNLDGWNGQMPADIAIVQRVFYFDINNDVAIQRCLERGKTGSGRADDNIESLEKRLCTYQNTAQVIEHYKDLAIVSEFSGENSVEEVYATVKNVILSILQ